MIPIFKSILKLRSHVILIHSSFELPPVEFRSLENVSAFSNELFPIVPQTVLHDTPNSNCPIYTLSSCTHSAVSCSTNCSCSPVHIFHPFILLILIYPFIALFILIQQFVLLLILQFVPLLVHQFVPLLIHQFVPLLIHQLLVHQFIPIVIRQFVLLLNRQFVSLLFHQFILLLLHQSVPLLIHQLVPLLVHLFILQLMHH